MQQHQRQRKSQRQRQDLVVKPQLHRLSPSLLIAAMRYFAAATAAGRRQVCLFACLAVALLPALVSGIKFDLEASHSPAVKCIWNYALSDTLVIVTLNVKGVPTKASSNENDQRIDVEVVDGSKHNNVYLSKKNIKTETRMAINTHSHADLGVCIKNTLRKGG